MVAPTPITIILRGAGCVALAAGLPLVALAQPVNLQPPGPSSSVSTLSLPAAALPPDATGQAQAHLAAARVADERGRIAEAEDALERAETDLLNQPLGVAVLRSPDADRAIRDIGVARGSLMTRDRQSVLLAINDAMSATTRVAPVLSPAPSAPGAPVPAEVTASPAPMVTNALLPGHWALQGWKYVWVPPDTVSRRVENRPVVQSHYVWRNGEWEWIPAHYGSD